jgi:hypothetical protein
MGQGTESCGGYEIDDDPYEDGLGMGDWLQKSGATINVSDMTLSHIRNTRERCKALAHTASFSNETDKWNAWIDIFDNELDRRKSSAVAGYKPKTEFVSQAKTPARGQKLSLNCHCGKPYTARVADLKRGWGMSCSRRCASIRREYGRPEPTVAGKPWRQHLKVT